MSLYPKWLLALAGLCILPVVLCPFYIFVFPEKVTFNSVLLYAIRQALWLVPAYSAYKGLDYYYREFERLGIWAVAFGALIAVLGLIVVFLL